MSEKKFTVLEQSGRLASLLTAGHTALAHHHPVASAAGGPDNADDGTAFELIHHHHHQDNTMLSYAHLTTTTAASAAGAAESLSPSPHHQHVHAHSPYSATAASATMLDHHHFSPVTAATALTSGAPSPPDSSTSSPDFSMSSSPLPPNLVPALSADRLPDGVGGSSSSSVQPHHHHHLASPIEHLHQQSDFTLAHHHQLHHLQTIGSPSIHHYHHLSTPSPSHNKPFLRIVEEPTNRIRYRYKSEKGSHGGLTGERSTPNKKTYPTVKLENARHASTSYAVRASLVTNEPNPRPHVHKLMGRYCTDDGVCIVQVGESETAVFQNLGILFVGKKEVPEILYQRKIEEHRAANPVFRSALPLSDADNQRLREEAEREAKDMNLNCVRICFQAFEYGQNSMTYPIGEPVFTRSVANQKSPDSGELKIVRMDRYSGSCLGEDEVYLLCEKVNKKEIKVRFFEPDQAGNTVWEAFGTFTEADVHHQVAIVFRTPPYRNTDLDDYAQVYLQLYRPKDNEYSEPRPFTYCPQAKPSPLPCLVEVKRKKPSPDRQSSSHDPVMRYNVQQQSSESLVTFYGVQP